MGLATQGEGTSWVTQRTFQSHCRHTTYSPESEEDLAPCTPNLHKLPNRRQNHVGVHDNSNSWAVLQLGSVKYEQWGGLEDHSPPHT